MKVYDRLCPDCKERRIIISMTRDEAWAFYNEHHPKERMGEKLDTRLHRLLTKLDTDDPQ